MTAISKNVHVDREIKIKSTDFTYIDFDVKNNDKDFHGAP